jgi:hypothetical protein
MATITTENVDIPIPVVVDSGYTSIVSGSYVIANLVNQSGDYVHIDSGSKALETISVVHSKVHDGQMYSITDYDADSDTGSGVNTVWLCYTLSTATKSHAVFELDASNEVLIDFYEGPTVSVTGTEIIARNFDRSSTNSSTMNFYKTAMVDSGQGTLLQHRNIGSATGIPAGTNIGGVARKNTEWILLGSGVYALTVTPINDNTRVGVNLEYYEV